MLKTLSTRLRGFRAGWRRCEGFLWSLCSSLCSMFHSFERKTSAPSFVHCVICHDARCGFHTLQYSNFKVESTHFLPKFPIHFICTMHWEQWSSGGTRNPAACFWSGVGIMMLLHLRALISILFEGEWSSIPHSKELIRLLLVGFTHWNSNVLQSELTGSAGNLRPSTPRWHPLIHITTLEFHRGRKSLPGVTYLVLKSHWLLKVCWHKNSRSLLETSNSSLEQLWVFFFV